MTEDPRQRREMHWVKLDDNQAGVWNSMAKSVADLFAW